MWKKYYLEFSVVGHKYKYSWPFLTKTFLKGTLKLYKKKKQSQNIDIKCVRFYNL